MTFEEWWAKQLESPVGPSLGLRRDQALFVWLVATEVERERCAKIADEYHRIDTPGEIGREIREGK
jgi:hypothetical protein